MTDEEFARQVAIDGTHDNRSDPDVLGLYGLQWERCACGRTIPGDVDQCDECRPAVAA